MAGREIAGPTGARADLFQGATWILTPTSATSPDVVKMAQGIVLELGADPKEVPAHDHDRAISSVSHLPQILSSVLAGLMNDLDEEDISLAGQGLRDMTRLADSNPQLWSELLIANASFLKEDIEKIQENLSLLIAALKSKERNEVEKILAMGNSGKKRIPGKHGKPSREYAYLPIVIDDKPGQLSAIFEQCASVSVNVEDLFIEHSPGQETGLITLALSPTDAKVLHQHLSQKNWRVHEIRVQR
jgi:prephenate dehydrogenase